MKLSQQAINELVKLAWKCCSEHFLSYKLEEELSEINLIFKPGDSSQSELNVEYSKKPVVRECKHDFKCDGHGHNDDHYTCTKCKIGKFE
jgi:hypothetical protein